VFLLRISGGVKPGWRAWLESGRKSGVWGRGARREARAIRRVFDTVNPALELATHEGFQDETFLLATESVPRGLGAAVVEALKRAGIKLAARSPFSPLVPLDAPGLMEEGWAITVFQRLIRLHTLAMYANDRGVGDLTTESPWQSPDLDARILAHVLAVRAAAEALAELPRSPR